VNQLGGSGRNENCVSAEESDTNIMIQEEIARRSKARKERHGTLDAGASKLEVAKARLANRLNDSRVIRATAEDLVQSKGEDVDGRGKGFALVVEVDENLVNKGDISEIGNLLQQLNKGDSV